MGVQVDQAGGDDPARSVVNLCCQRGQPLAQFHDLAAREGDIGDTIEVLRRVDDPAAGDDEIERHETVLLCAVAK
jgi:hypothetical protein